MGAHVISFSEFQFQFQRKKIMINLVGAHRQFHFLETT